MIRLLVLNDVHAADRPPASRTDDYRDRILAKLEECVAVAVERKADYILVTGDLFHSKVPRFNSHFLNRELTRIAKAGPPWLILPGNHDMGAAGIESLTTTQPMAMLEMHDVFTLLLEDKLLFDRTASPQALCVQLSPAPYVDNIDADPANYGLKRQPMVNYAVKVAHGMLVPKKDSPHWTARHVAHTTFDQVPTRHTDLVLWGHPHFDYGDTVVKSCRFVSFGSLSRVANDPTNRKRKVRVAEVTFTKQGIEVVSHVLKSARSADEVFLQRETVGEEAELGEPLTAFARRLSHSLQSESWSDLDQILAPYLQKSKRVPKRTLELVRHYIAESGWD